MVGQIADNPQNWRYLFVTAALASASALPAHAAAPPNAVQGNPDVIVTATKRSENVQRVPVAIQALTPQVLAAHQVGAMDDYAKLLPSLSFQSFGPGQSQLFFRGISSGGDGLHGGSETATGSYIDEIPVSTIANGVDLHVYDIARVEALSGPQGTLFGANSLSGTLRIITNQPSTSAFSAAYDLQVTKFGKGDFGGVAEGYVNEPLGDRAAIRLVAFYEKDGGYIDNVLKSRTFTLTPGSNPPTDTLTVNNARFVKNNFNDVTTYGGRAALKIDLDEHWTVTPSVIWQHQVADGSGLYDPKLGNLKVADFAPDRNVDDWYQAALTIQGKIADWDVIYAGGYFGRRVNNQADYSYYSVAYDNAGYTSLVTFPDGHGGLLDPNQHFSGLDIYTKETHEFRVTSPSAKRFRVVAGLFAQRQTDQITANYFIPGLLASGDGGTVPGAGDDIFYTRIDRVDRDYAAFGEAAFDILPNLTLTGGIRGFSVENTLVGFSGFLKNTLVGWLPTTMPGFPCISVIKKTNESGETHKVNLTWRIDPRRMVYFTYSTGFRPGGNNRQPLVNPYQADTLSNYELGWKTSWLDGRLRINGAIFYEDWQKLQFGFSPVGSNGVTNIYNAGAAVSKGVEGDVTWRLSDQWTLSGAGTYVDARLTKDICGAVVNGNLVCGLGPSPLARSGEKLPVQPAFKADATLRYDFDVRDYRAYVQGSIQGQTSSRSFLPDVEATAFGDTAGFASFDFSAGVSRDNWTLDAFVQNAFDKRGQLSLNTVCSTTFCGPFARIYPIKPQFFGIKFGQKF